MTGKIMIKNHAIQNANIFLDLHSLAKMVKIEIKKAMDKMNDHSNGVFTSGTT